MAGHNHPYRLLHCLVGWDAVARVGVRQGTGEGWDVVIGLHGMFGGAAVALRRCAGRTDYAQRRATAPRDRGPVGPPPAMRYPLTEGRSPVSGRARASIASPYTYDSLIIEAIMAWVCQPGVSGVTLRKNRSGSMRATRAPNGCVRPAIRRWDKRPGSSGGPLGPWEGREVRRRPSFPSERAFQAPLVDEIVKRPVVPGTAVDDDHRTPTTGVSTCLRNSNALRSDHLRNPSMWIISNVSTSIAA